MAKKAIIEILLVPESLEKSSQEIEEEILKEFHEEFLIIPYGDRIEKIKIVETSKFRTHNQPHRLQSSRNFGH